MQHMRFSGESMYSRSKQRLDIQRARQLVTMSLATLASGQFLTSAWIVLRLDNCKDHNLVMPHRPNDLSIYTLKKL